MQDCKQRDASGVLIWKEGVVLIEYRGGEGQQ